MTFSRINLSYRKITILFLALIHWLGVCAALAQDANQESNSPLANESTSIPVIPVIDTTKLTPRPVPDIEPLANPDALRPPGTPKPLHTKGNQILLPDDTPIKLRGVNIASLEWSDEGENILKSLDVAIHTWGVNIVRIPLSQDRWFGFSPTQEDGGKKHHAIVDELVTYASQHGTYIWLELHWNNLGVWGQYIGQHRMPDTLSLVFWKSVAARYANHPAVLFGVYNEPHHVTWDEWLHGGILEETIQPSRLQGDTSTPQPDRVTIRYQAVGHQELYNTVRAAGTIDNIVVISGIDWGYDLREAVDKYAIKGHNIAYDTHCYPWKAWSPERSWDLAFGNASKKIPVLVGEWGGNWGNAEHREFLDAFPQYLHTHNLSWTAWDLHPQAGPTLIKNWEYEPTELGETVLEELKRK